MYYSISFYFSSFCILSRMVKIFFSTFSVSSPGRDFVSRQLDWSSEVSEAGEDGWRKNDCFFFSSFLFLFISMVALLSAVDFMLL